MRGLWHVRNTYINIKIALGWLKMVAGKLQHQGMAPMVGAVPGAMGASMMGAQLGMPGLIAAVPSPWSAMQSLLPATQASSKAAGGWLCPACSNYNYAIRTNCNRCGIPKGTRISDAGLREGDWICMSCANHNYADKVNCNKCGLTAPNCSSHGAEG